MKQEPDEGYELLTLQSRRMLFKASDEELRFSHVCPKVGSFE
jgi:hypothetical protein